MNPPSLAFLLVALCYLQPEADYYARQLNLPCPSVLERTNIIHFDVLGGRDRLAGYIQTTNFIFHFRESGQLDYLTKHAPPEAESHLREYQKSLARQYSEVDPSGAYQLATQWLASVGVDIKMLNEKYHYENSYPELDKSVEVVSPEGKTSKVKIVPQFCITWGKRDPKPERATPYPAQVIVIGPTKELTHLAIFDQSLSSRSRIKVPGQSVLMDLPDEPFTNLWAHRELSATNVFGILHTSTAYQAVMLQRMVDEGNWAIRRLGLPPETQLSLESLTDSFVLPPQFGFRGFIGRNDIAFQFDEYGKLKYVFYSPGAESGLDQSSVEYYQQMSRRPMLLDSNSVIELATGWVKSLQIDVDALNRVTRPVVKRYNYASMKPSHLWWVTWPDPQKSDKPYLVVVLDGISKTPNRIRLDESAYALGASIAVTNAAELMEIPDRVAQHYPLSPHLNIRPTSSR